MILYTRVGFLFLLQTTDINCRNTHKHTLIAVIVLIAYSKFLHAVVCNSPPVAAEERICESEFEDGMGREITHPADVRMVGRIPQRKL